MASVDYYLKIDGIDGESTAVNFVGWIDVESYSWGVTQTGTQGGGGGGGAGKAVPQDFNFVHRVDKASPVLFLTCATGKHLKEAVMVARRSNPNVAFLRSKLVDILISSVQDGGSEGEVPLESVSLTYAAIEFSYRPILPNGQLGQEVKTAYDFKQQRSG